MKPPEYTVVVRDVDIIAEEQDDADGSGQALNGNAISEVELSETVIVPSKSPGFWSTLLWGIPGRFRRLSIATAAVNLCLVLMTLDMVYAGVYLHDSGDVAFSRVGFVSDVIAKMFVREPNPSQLPLFLSYRPIGTEESAWKSAGEVHALDNATDFSATLTIDNLRPDTLYHYVWSNRRSGYFVTGPSIGKLPSHPARGGSERFTFLHSSCILARFPYSPFAHPLSIKGLRYLSDWLPTLKAQFMLFLGDFIYIDVPHRHGSSVEHYRREYRQVYASPDWPPAAATLDQSPPIELPWIHVLDDHEIANDWDKNTTGVYAAAVDPFLHYHVAPNPPSLHPHDADTTYTVFTQGPVSVFLMDTRQYRSAEHLNRTSPMSAKTMLGSRQRRDLVTWLAAPLPSGVRWKVVVSSVPFTKNWRFGTDDTWGGYLSERAVILEAMWDAVQRGDGVIVLSGDRHEFAATRFDPPADGRWAPNVSVTEFSTGPLSQFYLPVRTYSQRDDEDVCLAYLPDGNSKFGAVEIRQTDDAQPSLLTYRLFIDGVETWSHDVASPVRRRRGFW